MICYRDMTFCNNHNCTCPEWRRLTQEVWADATRIGLPVSQADLCRATPPAPSGEEERK